MVAIEGAPERRRRVFPAITGRPDQRKRSVMSWPWDVGAGRVKLPLRLGVGCRRSGCREWETRAEGGWGGCRAARPCANAVSAAGPYLNTLCDRRPGGLRKVR
ncbi:hypothetical protein GCM10010303_32960 [Streptomyces purpurascens]|nr:hypothetical protein GCM10010303_32960 [Streptomyces purpurascens]